MKASMKKTCAAVLCAAMLGSTLCACAKTMQPQTAEVTQPAEQGLTFDAPVTYSEDTQIQNAAYRSTGKDENAITVEDGTVLLSDISVERTSEDSTGGDEASFYGVGAAVLVKGGEATIENAAITTDSKGGAGVFAYGDGIVTVENSTISTKQDTSGGVHVAGGGTLYAKNVKAETNGASSAAVRSDRGGGLLVIEGGEYTASGSGSPAVYATATIAAKDAALTATGSEAVCIEGMNSLYLYDCDLSGDMPDQEQNDCTWNVILYQSMSGDAKEGNSTFQMEGGTLRAKNGGMFYTTNTESTFVLKDAEIISAEDAEFLLKCTGNSNARGWGKTGENGADCTFTAISQQLSGDVLWDSISELSMYLTENSTLEGAILQDESCAGDGGDGTATLTIDSGSAWIVTKNSVLSALYNEGSIVDETGKAVTIKGADGTVFVQGESELSITVQTYGEQADLTGAGSITSFEDAQVNAGSQADGPMGEMPSGQQPPEMPNGQQPPMNGEQPPELPSGEMPQGGAQPPEMPNGQPPQMPSGEMPQDGTQPPERPDGQMPAEWNQTA